LALFGRRLSEREDGLGMPASENLHKPGLVRPSKLSDYPISSSASESGSAEVAMHYAIAACD
jgi:hypothetical protein